jgi:hypothetical protein
MEVTLSGLLMSVLVSKERALHPAEHAMAITINCDENEADEARYLCESALHLVTSTLIFPDERSERQQALLDWAARYGHDFVVIPGDEVSEETVASYVKTYILRTSLFVKDEDVSVRFESRTF